MPIDTQTVSIKETSPVKKMLNFVYFVACTLILYKLSVTIYDKKMANDLTKKNTACPALLSVGRSARDTLIIMKAETLCNDYVLETLK